MWSFAGGQTIAEVKIRLSGWSPTPTILAMRKDCKGQQAGVQDFLVKDSVGSSRHGVNVRLTTGTGPKGRNERLDADLLLNDISKRREVLWDVCN